MRGAKPKPTALKVIAGNPGRRPLNKGEPKPQGGLGEAPEWLTVSQREVWQLAVVSAPRGLLTRLDESVLLVWVIAKDLHQQASEALQHHGLMTETPHTHVPMQSPYLAIMNKQAQIMLKAAAEMGFTPSSRSRVVLSTTDSGCEEWEEF